jgi:hypothetical protein
MSLAPPPPFNAKKQFVGALEFLLIQLWCT